MEYHFPKICCSGKKDKQARKFSWQAISVRSLSLSPLAPVLSRGNHVKDSSEATLEANLPDDNDDAVKNVVGVLDVTPDAKGQELEEHLQSKHACEDNVADLQGIG